MPGHYLTRHNDVNPKKQRRVAYVLSLSKHWHPDWGGLLQFYQPDGTPKDAWAPQFNSMALFDVNHVHGVSYVAPFATQAKYSITGWFRAD
ncbi:MAG: SM-20-related protein [Paraglaciecola sp.]